MSNENNESGGLQRTIDWKQGLAIALGVPVLILPSIGYFASYVWAFAIIVWALSVFQGFMQNFAYGELATMFPKASGLPGYAQSVFGAKGGNNGYDKANCLEASVHGATGLPGTLCLQSFQFLIGSYLKGLIPAFAGVPDMAMYLASGATVFLFLILVNNAGFLEGNAWLYPCSALACPAYYYISLAPFVTGQFELSNITGSWLPTDWSWDVNHILILFGLMAMAQWSACAWETAAIYGLSTNSLNLMCPKPSLFVGRSAL
jgi:amino acid transporter